MAKIDLLRDNVEVISRYVVFFDEELLIINQRLINCLTVNTSLVVFQQRKQHSAILLKRCHEKKSIFATLITANE